MYRKQYFTFSFPLTFTFDRSSSKLSSWLCKLYTVLIQDMRQTDRQTSSCLLGTLQKL